MRGTCSNCKKKNIEVQKVSSYKLCQRCWAASEEKVRNQFPVFKLNIIQRSTNKTKRQIKTSRTYKKAHYDNQAARGQ